MLMNYIVLELQVMKYLCTIVLLKLRYGKKGCKIMSSEMRCKMWLRSVLVHPEMFEKMSERLLIGHSLQRGEENNNSTRFTQTVILIKNIAYCAQWLNRFPLALKDKIN